MNKWNLNKNCSRIEGYKEFAGFGIDGENKLKIREQNKLTTDKNSCSLTSSKQVRANIPP